MQAIGLFDMPASGVETTAPSGQPKRRQMLKRVDSDLLDALRLASITPLGDCVALDLPQLPAKTYAKAKDMLAVCGFIWSSAAKTHFGNEQSAQTFADIVASGFWNDTKRALEFYGTAPHLAAALAVDLAKNVWSESTPRILEPSAGNGALVDAILQAIPDVEITAVELDPARAADLRARFLSDGRVKIICADILTFEETGYDGVLTNPPFAASLEHLRHVSTLARRGAYIIGIAMLTRAQDEAAAFWLNDHDAIVWDTGKDAFIGTTMTASCFSFRAGRTVLDELRTALEPHQSIGEPHIRILTRISRDLHRLFTAHCNGEIESDDYNRLITEYHARVLSLVGHENIALEMAWDPRAGHGFRLVLPSGRTNDFGRTGIIVPCAHERDQPTKLPITPQL